MHIQVPNFDDYMYNIPELRIRASYLQNTMVGSPSLLQSLAGDPEKAASMLHSLAPEVTPSSPNPSQPSHFLPAMQVPTVSNEKRPSGTKPCSFRANLEPAPENPEDGLWHNVCPLCTGF